MKKEFLEAYNQELAILYERSREFAQDYPGIAERLGGLTEDKLDPGLAGLLEGSAYMAARVQLKLQSEFSTFTRALLEQLLPNYLAPTPAAMIVQATPDYTEKDLAKGEAFAAGAYLDATYVEREQRVSCRFRLSAPLTLWPFDMDRAAYLASPGPIQALGVDVLPQTSAGLHLRLFRRTTNE
ncbi:MAG: type VI secretion system baseplate subunit TssF, partial [Pseudomonadota bacterium]